MVLENTPDIICKNESRHRPYTLHKITQKWITDLNVKCKTMKFLEYNTEGNLDNPGFGNDFLDAPKAQTMKEKN